MAPKNIENEQAVTRWFQQDLKKLEFTEGLNWNMESS